MFKEFGEEAKGIRSEISEKRIVGINPAKENHQAVVLDEYRMQKGKLFSFQVNNSLFPFPHTSPKFPKNISPVIPEF